MSPSCNCRGGPDCCMTAGGRVWSDAFGFIGPFPEPVRTVEDFSDGHGHPLPDADGPRVLYVYGDGCAVVPGENGSWTYVPSAVPA